MVPFTDIQGLLKKVDRIERHSTEIARLRHERYNIFSLLRRAHDEEHLHSAFIADLLNPRGSHEMGTVFAELFFRTIAESFPLSDSTYVVTEKALPSGRADIYLETRGAIAIIENKIYAADQPEQLSRYHAYLQQHSVKEGVLIYLTLDGKQSKEAEAFNEEEKNADRTIEYTCVSYEEDVVSWLEQCHAKAADHPPLRETIKQYLTLVKRLTDQLTDAAMEKELKDAIRKDYSAATLISTYWGQVRSELVAEFMEQFANRVVAQLGGDWVADPEEDTYLKVVDKSYGKVTFRRKEWPKYSGVTLEGQSTMSSGRIIYGLMNVATNEPFKKVDFVKNHEVKNSWWLAYTTLMNVSTTEVLTDLATGTPTSLAVEENVTVVCRLCRALSPQ